MRIWSAHVEVLAEMLVWVLAPLLPAPSASASSADNGWAADAGTPQSEVDEVAELDGTDHRVVRTDRSSPTSRSN